MARYLRIRLDLAAYKARCGVAHIPFPLLEAPEVAAVGPVSLKEALDRFAPGTGAPGNPAPPIAAGETLPSPIVVPANASADRKLFRAPPANRPPNVPPSEKGTLPPSEKGTPLKVSQSFLEPPLQTKELMRMLWFSSQRNRGEHFLARYRPPPGPYII